MHIFVRRSTLRPYNIRLTVSPFRRTSLGRDFSLDYSYFLSPSRPPLIPVNPSSLPTPVTTLRSIRRVRLWTHTLYGREVPHQPILSFSRTFSGSLHVLHPTPVQNFPERALGRPLLESKHELFLVGLHHSYLT